MLFPRWKSHESLRQGPQGRLSGALPNSIEDAPGPAQLTSDRHEVPFMPWALRLRVVTTVTDSAVGPMAQIRVGGGRLGLRPRRGAAEMKIHVTKFGRCRRPHKGRPVTP